MADFIDVDITTDPEELKQIIVDAMQLAFPTWEPNPGSWEDVFAEAVAMVAADTRDLSAKVPKSVFRAFGTKLVGLPPDEAASASAQATVTVVDNAGYTIPAGTEWALTGSNAEELGFAVAADVVIPPGSTSTAVGGVLISAVEEGAAYNGLSGTVEQVDSLAFINTITITAPTAGGLDAEDDDVYLDRLTRELRLLAPRPILPHDFEVLYRRIAGVARALCIDLYNPNTATYGNPRTVTMVGVDEAGAAIAPGVKATALAYIQERREVNFLVFTMDPTYTPVNVTFAATCYEGFVAADVEAAAEAAITNYLSPGTWGDTPFGEEAEWVEKLNVDRLELGAVLNAVTGLDRVTSLTLSLNADPLATADLTLPGPAGLPTVGTINGTVTAP